LGSQPRTPSPRLVGPDAARIVRRRSRGRPHLHRAVDEVRHRLDLGGRGSALPAPGRRASGGFCAARASDLGDRRLGQGLDRSRSLFRPPNRPGRTGRGGSRGSVAPANAAAFEHALFPELCPREVLAEDPALPMIDIEPPSCRGPTRRRTEVGTVRCQVFKLKLPWDGPPRPKRSNDEIAGLAASTPSSPSLGEPAVGRRQVSSVAIIPAHRQGEGGVARDLRQDVDRASI